MAFLKVPFQWLVDNTKRQRIPGNLCLFGEKLDVQALDTRFKIQIQQSRAKQNMHLVDMRKTINGVQLPIRPVRWLPPVFRVLHPETRVSAFSMKPGVKSIDPCRGSMARRHNNILSSHSGIQPTTILGF